MGDMPDTRTAAMTKDDYDRQYPDSPPLFDLDLGRNAWRDALSDYFWPKQG